MLLKEINCPLCSHNNYKVLKEPAQISEDELKNIYRSSSDKQLFERVVQCKDCDLVYLNPILDSKFIVDSYKEAIDDTFITQNQYRIDTFKSAFKEVLHYLSIKPSPAISVLDIGCAGGAFLKAVKDLGLTPVGVEPSAYLSDYARKTYNVDVRSGILEEQNFPQRSFDIITMWDVVEHLTNPNQVLRQIKGLLKPNGHLVINYPDYSTLTARAFGWKWPFWLSVHLTYFSPKTVKELHKRNGFEVLRYKRHWQKLELGYLFNRASKYFGFFSYFEKFVKLIKLDKVPVYYYLGQIQVVAKIQQ